MWFSSIVIKIKVVQNVIMMSDYVRIAGEPCYNSNLFTCSCDFNNHRFAQFLSLTTTEGTYYIMKATSSSLIVSTLVYLLAMSSAKPANDKDACYGYGDCEVFSRHFRPQLVKFSYHNKWYYFQTFCYLYEGPPAKCMEDCKKNPKCNSELQPNQTN